MNFLIRCIQYRGGSRCQSRLPIPTAVQWIARLLYEGFGIQYLADRVGGEYGIGWTCPECKAQYDSGRRAARRPDDDDGRSAVHRDVASALKDGLCLKALRQSDGFVVSASRTRDDSGYLVRYRPSDGWQDGVSVSPLHMPLRAADDFVREVGENAARQAVLEARRTVP
jgi:hypothetical protein